MKTSLDTTGNAISLIAAERLRQIETEGWTPERDDEHIDRSLAMAACCYAAPERLWMRRDNSLSGGLEIYDPWPWNPQFDERRHPGGAVMDTSSYSPQERLDLLVKAGALIAAEIDRHLRADARTATENGGDP